MNLPETKQELINVLVSFRTENKKVFKLEKKYVNNDKKQSIEEIFEEERKKKWEKKKVVKKTPKKKVIKEKHVVIVDEKDKVIDKEKELEWCILNEIIENSKNY